MSDIPTISYWMGRPVTELTREELIGALEIMGQEYLRTLKDKEHEREFIFHCFMRPRDKCPR